VKLATDFVTGDFPKKCTEFYFMILWQTHSFLLLLEHFRTVRVSGMLQLNHSVFFSRFKLWSFQQAVPVQCERSPLQLKYSLLGLTKPANFTRLFKTCPSFWFVSDVCMFSKTHTSYIVRRWPQAKNLDTGNLFCTKSGLCFHLPCDRHNTSEKIMDFHVCGKEPWVLVDCFAVKENVSVGINILNRMWEAILIVRSFLAFPYHTF